MKLSKIIAAAALSVLAITAANAETYEGVHPLTIANNRPDVAAEAVLAARSGNMSGDLESSMVAAPLANPVDREIVRAQAVAAAQAPNQNLDRKAFVNSVIPAQYKIAPPMAQAAL